MGTDLIDLSPTQQLRVLSATEDELVVESTWQGSGSPPPTHWHPAQREELEVLEGELTVRLGDEEAVYKAGSSFVVSPRIAHSMWNAGELPCRARWRVTPPLRTLEMWHSLGSASLPRKVAGLWTFRREFRLGKPRA